MNAKKIIALLLAAMLCLPLLAACADEGGGENTRPVTGDGAQDVGNFADGDFDGEDFTFLNILNAENQKDYYNGNYLDADGLTGATIEDAVYKRNLAVEEKYNVVITQRTEYGNPSEVLNMFFMSGDFCFDVIYGWGYKMGSIIPMNYFADFAALPNIDLTQEYWSPSAMEELTVNDKVYICINDITMNKLEWGGFLFYNKQISEDYNVESTLGNFYDLVEDGKWTLDTYLQAVTSVSHDVDGNGVIDRTDVYGLVEGDKNGLNVGFGCGINLAEKQDDGSYKLNYYNDKVLDIANSVQDVYTTKKYVWTYDMLANGADPTGYNGVHEYYRSFFAKDNALFCTGSANITGEFRDMESDYGIIPMPKYDENQKNYIATIDSNAAIFAIPSTYRNDVSSATPDRTGAILEYMSYKSNQILLPQYYDTLLKGQRLSSDQDQAMLDIIRNSIHYDFAAMVGEVDPNTGMNKIVTNAGEIFLAPKTASSKYARDSKKLQKELDEFYTEVLLLDSKNAEE